jgi:hypothetical protein
VKNGKQVSQGELQIKFGDLNIFIKKSNMVQPKYSPEEALQRVKLMMGYDTKKTLKENREIIFEQEPTLSNVGIATGVGAGTGAAIMGSAAAANVATTTALGAGAYSAAGIGATLAPSLGVTAAAALGGAVVTGAVALAVVPLVLWYMDKDGAKPKVERIMKYCVSDAAKIAKVPRGNSESEIRNLSDQLYDAMNGAGTDEEKVYEAFKALKSASDFCALVNRFNKDYGSQGDLLEWLDGDFDATSEWEQIFRPIRDVVEDTLMTIKDDTVEDKCKTNPNDPACKKVVKKGGGYKPCTGTYQFGCQSDVIAKVQGCLGGLSQDGKFGPKTKAKLSAKGFTTFTDADVEKICSEVETKLTSDVESSDLSGEENVALTSGGQSVDPNTKDGIS